MVSTTGSTSVEKKLSLHSFYENILYKNIEVEIEF